MTHDASARPRLPLPRAAALARTIGQVRLRALGFNWPLLLIVLAGIGLRLWFISITTLDPRSSSADDGDYFRRALRLAITGQYLDDSWLIRPPLHVFFFALWLRIGVLFGKIELGVLLIQLAQTALSAANIVLGASIARRVFQNNRAGLLYALFLAVWFPFVEQPSVLFSELLYLFLFLLHMWLLARFDTTGRRASLVLSGLALGAAALTRSPALYSLAFVALWLLFRSQGSGVRRQETRDTRHETSEFKIQNSKFKIWPSAFSVQPSAFSLHPSSFSLQHLRSVVPQVLIVALACLAVVGPWTARNYLVYRQFIPVDTLGQINLWLDLEEVSAGKSSIEELRRLPQAERQAYAMGRAREILAQNPGLLFRDMWPAFRHVWKAQYVEDYFVKESFYGRPLRAAAPLGLPGDLIWLVYVGAGLAGLASRPREGWHYRLFVLAWVGYTLLTVLVFHVEPRYLVPLWTLIGLYGAGTLAGLFGKPVARQIRSWRAALLPAAVLVAFFALLLTYRDYPALIARGLAREQLAAAGERAYLGADYARAEQLFRQASEVQPEFYDAQVNLALALIAQGRYDAANAAIEQVDLRRASVLRGFLAGQRGDLDAARAILSEAELTAGVDVQRWAVEWLRPPPASAVQLGQADLGYVEGFSGVEVAPEGSFRWLENQGRLVLPLPAPIAPGASVALRMAAPRPTPLTVRIGDSPPRQIDVAAGQWRVYLLPVPETLVGQRQLVVSLDAPAFIPAHQSATSDDMRTLSLLVGGVSVRPDQ